MKLILNILLIVLIISTISICVIKPDMHKTVIVYNSVYTIVPEKQVVTENETIPIMEQPSLPKQEIIKKEAKVVVQEQNYPKQNITTTSEKKISAKPVKSAITTSNNVAIQQKETTKNVQKPTNTNDSEVKPIVQNNVQNIQTVVQPKPIVKEIKPSIVQQKVLTEQEENIAWNTWRSNLQNRIMQDSKLPYIPNGTVFKFSFTVDKYGKILNLQTWSETPGYTPYAIQYIAPVIRSYQGHSILNFPTGTARERTEVKGGWKISDNERYSRPQDYNDIEKVRGK